MKLEKSLVAISLVIGLVLNASAASPAPVFSGIAAVKATVSGDVVTVLCQGSVSARAHSCYDRHRDHTAKIDIVDPAVGNRGRGCFIATDRTRGLRHWSPSC
jgi:hypothetical protein